jgi:cation transport ATPase
MPCDMDFSMYYSIYYQAKIAVINEDKILKYFTIDLFVVTYCFIVTLLICIFCTRADIDMHFLHGVLIWVIVTPCKLCIITPKYMINTKNRIYPEIMFYRRQHIKF